jgi:hypothetical protein
MKLAHLDHLLNMVSKFEQDRGHELGMKKTSPKKTQILMKASTFTKVGKSAHIYIK